MSAVLLDVPQPAPGARVPDWSRWPLDQAMRLRVAVVRDGAGQLWGVTPAIDDVRLATIDNLPQAYPVVGPPCGKLAIAAPGRFQVLDESLWQPHAVNVGRIGLHMLERQEFSDPDTLEPVYIRVSYAEEKRVLR